MKVKLSVGNYVDDVLCDVIPLEACHVLLERPWQFDKKTIHDGLTNEITFIHKHQKFVLHPLTPTQVLEDEAQMKQKSIKRGNEKHKITVFRGSCTFVLLLIKHTFILEDNFCSVIFFSNFL